MAMENNNLKENIRKKVQEKIAVSNIREEFDMKSKKIIKLYMEYYQPVQYLYCV